MQLKILTPVQSSIVHIRWHHNIFKIIQFEQINQSLHLCILKKTHNSKIYQCVNPINDVYTVTISVMVIFSQSLNLFG